MIVSDELYAELMQDRIANFVIYHQLMDQIGDIDPSYPMLRYVCDRYELNMEQRYWLAFLFATCYCAPTVFYIYNEFPDYENVDVGRLSRWWSAHKNQCIFQSDRLWIRSRDQFVPMFESYREHIGFMAQEDRFQIMLSSFPEETYSNAYKYFSSVKYFGRFSMFLYLEAVHVVTGFPMHPDTIDWRNAQSSRNGLCFAMGNDGWLRGHGHSEEQLPMEAYSLLDEDYHYLIDLLKHLNPNARVDAWNVETTLCAYKKWELGQADPKRQTSTHYRWPGYYLDRQHDEIVKMESNVPLGVDWSVLWDMRRETFSAQNLMELGANNKAWGEMEMQRRIASLRDDKELL